MRISLYFRDQRQTSFISQILKVVGPLVKEVKVFISLGNQMEKDLNDINTRIKLQSVRALKRYLYYDNLTHDQKAATIQTFTNQNL